MSKNSSSRSFDAFNLKLKIVCSPKSYHCKKMRIFVIMLLNFIQFSLVLVQQGLREVVRVEGLKLLTLRGAVVAVVPPGLQLLPDLDHEHLQVLQLQHLQLLQLELKLKVNLDFGFNNF